MSFLVTLGWFLLVFSAGTCFGAIVAFNIAAGYHDRKENE
jgi:surfactin synthase thioesterase subunit